MKLNQLSLKLEVAGWLRNWDRYKEYHLSERDFDSLEKSFTSIALKIRLRPRYKNLLCAFLHSSVMEGIIHGTILTDKATTSAAPPN